MPPPVPSAAKKDTSQHEVFNYKTLRLLVGIVALALPFVVLLAARNTRPPIDSISASYWVDNARDLFVGGLFMIATLMLAYNGHDPSGDAHNVANGEPTPHPLVKWLSEKWLSKVAAIMAAGVALFPTTKPNGEPTTDTVLHYVSAVALFAIITYFCLGSFRKRALEKAVKADRLATEPDEDEGKQREIARKARLRASIYGWCGIFMILSLLLAATSFIDSIGQYFDWWNLFLGETVALIAFGVSWFTAAHVIPGMIPEEERNRIMEF